MINVFWLINLLDNYYTALESGFSSFCLLHVLPTLSSTLPLSLSHAQFLHHLLIALYHFRMGVRVLVLNHFSFVGISHIARRHANMGIPVRDMKMGTPVRYARMGIPMRHVRMGTPVRNARMGLPMVLSVSPNFPNCIHFVVTWNYPCLKHVKFILLL